VLEQEPGRTFAAEPAVADGRVGLISRVPHASDTLSGRITRDTEFPPGDHRAHRNRDNMLDNFDKAETLAFLWEGTGRTVGQAAIAGILADPAFVTVLPTCVTVDDVTEYAAASDLPLTGDEKARLDALWDDNFGVTNRYEMPLKSSTGG
jgi:aryl-alcohol dehydrogenase-like predicted oxidoreductase